MAWERNKPAWLKLRRLPVIYNEVTREDARLYFTIEGLGLVDKLHGELKTILAKPEIKEQLLKLSLLPMETKSVAEMQGFVKSEIVRWGKVVEAAGIKESQ